MSLSKSTPAESDRLSVPRPRPAVSEERPPSVMPSHSAYEGSWTARDTRLDIGAYLEIPFKHKRLVLGTLLSLIILGWLAMLVWPRTYESEAKIVVRVGRESVALEPTATTSQTLMLQKTQEEEINSALEVLSSRRLAEQVVESIGSENILNGSLPSTGNTPLSWSKRAWNQTKSWVSDAAYHSLRFVGLKDDLSDRELAIREIQNKLNIWAPKRSNVITIHAEAKTPAMAQAIASTLTDEFLDKHLQVNTTVGSHAFFETEASSAQERLDTLENHRSKFMQEHEVVSIADNRSLLREQLASIDLDLINFQSQLEQAEAEATDLRNKIANTVDEIVAAKQEASDGTWSAMRQRTYELQLRERELAAKYTSGHRLLVQVREQLEGAQAIMEQLQSERVNASRTPNPAKRRLQEELQRQETRIAGLHSALTEKKRQRGEVQKEVDSLLDLERELTEQDREISLIADSLLTLRSKQEEARVIDQLQEEKISNLSVFQPATFVERAISPQKKILMVLIAALGLAGGVGLSYLREASSRKLTTATEVESQLQLPVLTTVPSLKHTPTSTAANPVLRQHALKVLSEILLAGGRSDREGYVLGVLGVDKDSGATTQAIQLALAAADDCNMRTVLIDADTKHRSLSTSFKLNGHPGLVELVNGDATPSDCLQQSSRSDVELIACSSMSNTERLTQRSSDVICALDAYRASCDMLVIDLPPAANPDHAIGLTRHFDGVVVVIESENTSITDAERLVSRMRASGVQVLGAVLNKRKEHLPAIIRPFVHTAG